MSEQALVVDEEQPSLRNRALAKIASLATPSRVAVYGGVGSLVLASTAFASGAGIGASSAASYITTDIVPDVAVVATALMALAAAIYGFKWILSLLV
ncbi:hypothetical protein HER14_12440 [Acidithiobacillus thiooxidans]|uniref:major capsid protein n=1 Tax=Acidithiobacillus TaxID=119977 RepID=UPI00187ABAAD|nr:MULTISPECIES: major capsid protein [Acidithiobacillus]MBE7566421.1 hypothetical protein [Acidithiobacillus sp. HP-11]MBU2751718.1 hypothetical protein [Acidithiobacillus thiooxidans]